MIIYVEIIYGGAPHPIEVCSHDTIHDVKKQIETQYNIPAHGYRLVRDGTHLNDDKTLSDYNIFKGSVLRIVYIRMADAKNTTSS